MTNFQAMRPRNRLKVKTKNTKNTLKIGNSLLFTIAGYRHPEIGRFPSNETQKSADFWVFVTRKSAKTKKKFEIILGCDSRA